MTLCVVALSPKREVAAFRRNATALQPLKLRQTQTGLKALLSEIDAAEIVLLEASSELLSSHSAQQETNMKDAPAGSHCLVWKCATHKGVGDRGAFEGSESSK